MSSLLPRLFANAARKYWMYLRLAIRGRDLEQSEYDNNLIAWFNSIISNQAYFARRGLSAFGNYYEFGVGKRTLSAFCKAVRNYCLSSGHSRDSFRIFCFDSFSGLPAKSSWRDNTIDWSEGMFKTSQESMHQLLKLYDLDQNARFIPGFYETTLTDGLRKELRAFPPAIVTIDVDYYSSTKLILNWLQPILQSGTLFYFDDIFSFHGNPYYGETAAITEFNRSKRHGLTPIPIYGLPAHSFVFWRYPSELSAKRDRRG